MIEANEYMKLLKEVRDVAERRGVTDFTVEVVCHQWEAFHVVRGKGVFNGAEKMFSVEVDPLNLEFLESQIISKIYELT